MKNEVLPMPKINAKTLSIASFNESKGEGKK